MPPATRNHRRARRAFGFIGSPIIDTFEREGKPLRPAQSRIGTWLALPGRTIAQ
jgi:hypothetical protein